MKQLKKFTAVFLCIATLFAFSPVFSSAQIKGSLRESVASAASAAKAVGVYDMTDKLMLYTKNSEKEIAVGSITKVLTACVASQYFKSTDILRVGSEQGLLKSYASRAPVYSGQRYYFKDLLAAMLVPSGCDAAYAIAANTARKASGNSDMSAYEAISYFTKMMNSFCTKLGCTNSHFVNPDGQDANGQHTTVSDYLKVAEYAMSTKVIQDVVKNYYYSCRDLSGNYHGWSTTNSMVNPNSYYHYSGAIGTKTGSTPYAGGCLLCTVSKNGKTIITLVTGTHYTEDDYSQRFITTHKILDVIEPFLERRGDINNDGERDTYDAREILRIALGKITIKNTNIADYDLNGTVSVKDARTALRIATGLDEYQTEKEKKADAKERQARAKRTLAAEKAWEKECAAQITG